MRQRSTLLLGCLTFAAGLLLAHSAAYSQTFDPTHYWSYKLLSPRIVPDPIRVSDQFYRVPVAVQVDSLTHLLNWVQKNNSAVTDTFTHYLWWNIPPKLPTQRDVVIDNQFGSFPVHVTNLEFLLSPAYKNANLPIPPWTNRNHYTCYRAQAPGPPGTWFLRDEWRSDVQDIGELKYLCLPCFKEHLGQIYPPADTLTHLAVYEIHPQSDYFIPAVFDQFIQGQILVQQSPPEYLFVPSLKHDIPTDVKRRSWGRIKTLYR